MMNHLKHFDIFESDKPQVKFNNEKKELRLREKIAYYQSKIDFLKEKLKKVGA